MDGYWTHQRRLRLAEALAVVVAMAIATSYAVHAESPVAMRATAATANPLAGKPGDGPAARGQCGAQTKDAIQAVLETLGSAVINRNVPRALALYTDDAVIYPLGTTRPTSGRPAIRSHYIRELRPHRQLVLTGLTARVDCATTVVVGSYGYASLAHTGPALGTLVRPTKASTNDIGALEPPVAPAPYRFRMVLVAQGGDWLISEHVQTIPAKDAEHRAKLRGTTATAGMRPDATPPAGGQTFGWSSITADR